MFKVRFIRFGTPLHNTYSTLKEAIRFATSIVEENYAVPTEIRNGETVLWRYKDGINQMTDMPH